MSTFNNQLASIDLPRNRMLLFLLLPLAHGLRFHPYFTPGMVLQRDAANIIWGYDALGEVRASLSCLGEKGGRGNQKTIGSATTSAAAPCVPVTLSVTFLVSQAPLNRAVKIGII